ncbi:MAG: cysteine desulfurase-like protein [Anaerolineales bacterium]|nr:cysteine desulfurase-like protein [Anaerolineales bacterium]
MPLTPSQIRAQFPALQRANDAIFFDNPGGTQVAQSTIDRITRYLVESNANHGGAFATSAASDAVLDEAHAACADFYNAARPEEIIFGNNMTTLTLHFSRALSRTWNPGDEIVVTRLDHDANVTPWVLAAQDRGVTVRWVDFDPEDGTLDLDSLARALENKPRLLAVGYASNALGTINPLEKIIPMAHAAGAQVYVDAVQFAAHGVIDVQKLGCEYLVSSSYKWWGPHAGILYGRYDLIDALTPYKVRPATDTTPGKWETGTQNHEGIAGILGALEYLEWVGQTFGTGADSRKGRLNEAMTIINAYEQTIGEAVMDILENLPGCRVYGITDRDRFADRVPTFSFTLEGHHPRTVAEKLAAENIYVWDGNYYALNVTERLGLEGKGGMVRVGPVHYNTLEEVARLGDVLKKIE